MIKTINGVETVLNPARITGVLPGVNPTDVVTMQQLSRQDSGYIPYTGAVDDVNLGVKNLTTGTFNVIGSDSNYTSIQPYTGATTIPAIYLATNSPSSTNYMVLGDGTNTVFNAPRGFFLRTNNITFLQAYVSFIGTPTNNSLVDIAPITVSGIAATNNITGFRKLGGIYSFNDGTTSVNRENYFTAGTWSGAQTAAVITDAIGMDVAAPTAGSLMTFTRSWALRAIGNAAVSGRLFIGASTTAPTAFCHIAASTTSYASMCLTQGSAPSAPVDGDIWREDNTNTGLKIRINGVTKTITVS